MDNNKVWFVTGASKGLGLTLIKLLLNAGNKVAATSRMVKSLTNDIKNNTENFLPLEVTLTEEDSVKAAVEKTIAAFGRIDVVVNNAGYGQMGTLEELTDEEAHRNFDINVFGSLNVIRHVMPHLRSQRSGYIFNIASIGGYFGNFSGWGIYCATKFAVAGFTESLAAESKAFGIHATVVYPGYFRTNFLSEGSLVAPDNPISDYEEARASRNLHQSGIDGNQPGDPKKAMELLIQVAYSENPPVHLFLGQDAYDLADLKNSLVEKDRQQWKNLATATAFTDENQSV